MFLFGAMGMNIKLRKILNGGNVKFTNLGWLKLNIKLEQTLNCETLNAGYTS
jgi:hypothetical protein